MRTRTLEQLSHYTRQFIHVDERIQLEEFEDFRKEIFMNWNGLGSFMNLSRLHGKVSILDGKNSLKTRVGREMGEVCFKAQ